ncbi:hypothetical protein [Burkholderia sp. JKS000303]|uniref:hypothetical protein n=1 Tax=Burkholderia sp. JKS000303 TaxID=1938747 RepID=UPI000BF61032|nr:hypothetical protein [Burkholderia sp. JKS000303]PFH29155.1 hypothetical protein BX604_2927 [Burkholderia sp. JKS000303]
MSSHWQETLKAIFAWIFLSIGHAISSVTMANIALAATTVYSVLSAYVLVRDKLLKRRKGTPS